MKKAPAKNTPYRRRESDKNTEYDRLNKLYDTIVAISRAHPGSNANSKWLQYVEQPPTIVLC